MHVFSVWIFCSNSWSLSIYTMQPKGKNWPTPQKRYSPGSSVGKLCRICCMPSAPRALLEGDQLSPKSPMVAAASACIRTVASCLTSSVSVSMTEVEIQNLVKEAKCGQSGSGTPLPLDTMARIFFNGISRLCISAVVRSSRLDWCLLARVLLNTKSRFDALCVAIGADPLLKQLLSILEGDANDNILKYSETSVAAYPTFFGGKLQTTRKRSKEMDSLFRNYIFFLWLGGGDRFLCFCGATFFGPWTTGAVLPS